MNQKQVRIIADIIIVILFAIAGIIVGLLIGSNSNLRTELANTNIRPTPTIYITTTKTASPKIIRKIEIKYRNGYQNINDDPLWNCAGNWYNAYIRLANGGPAGDSSLWNYYCPGIQEPAN